MPRAKNPAASPPAAIELPPRTSLETLGAGELAAMAEAGREVLECYRVLRKTGDTIQGELLRDVATVEDWRHYPEGDVYDRDSASQYYFHAHPRAERPDEAGHFHTFLRAPGMPSGALPVARGPAATADPLSHLVAIAIDHDGYPVSLFTVNRWVTGDAWYRAEDVCRMVERFEIDQARPSWVLNRWITAMLRLYRPLVMDLVRERDLVVAERARTVDGDVFEDRGLETPSAAQISLAKQIAALRKLQA